jgi:hypothetical protein
MASPNGLPQNKPTYRQLRPLPKRAMASFDNLVALANHQERLKEAKKMVWRDRGEPAVEMKDIWECVEHAGRGGMSAWFAARKSVCGVGY